MLTDLTEIVRDVYDYRYLLFQLSLRDIKLRYKQAVMGFAWAVFMPSMIVLAGLAVRFAMAKFSGGHLDGLQVASLSVKAVPWAFFVGTLQFATNSLTSNTNLVTKVYFPREVLPLSATLAQLFDALVASIVLLAILLVVKLPASPALFAVPLIGLLLIVMTVAVALFVSCANLFFRDVKYIVQVMLTFGIFFTPVFFEPATFGRTGATIMMLNPLAPLLEGFRLSIVEHWNVLQPLIENGITVWHPAMLAYSAAWTVLGLVGSAVLFHRMQILFAEYA